MGWLTGWGYRKGHILTKASGAGTNYQVRVVVHYGNGTDSGENVYLNNNCRTDFGDIRFTAFDGDYLLSYWMESKVDSDYAIFWVKVSESLNSKDQTIYLYHGKADAITTSNGTNTFIFFDDFSGDLSAYTQSPSGRFDIYSGYLRRYGTGQDEHIYKTTAPSINDNIVFMSKISEDNDDSKWVCIIARQSGITDFYLAQISVKDNQIQLYKKVDNNWTQLGSTIAMTFNKNVWYLVELRMSGTTIKLFVNNVEKISVSDDAHSSGTVGARTGTVVGTLYWDNFIVRKYIDPEPSHGTWGDLEDYTSWSAYENKLFIIDKEDNLTRINLNPFLDEQGINLGEPE